jgi:hypothetical protein
MEVHMGGPIDNSSSQKISNDSMIESTSLKQVNAGGLLKSGMKIGMNSKASEVEEKDIRHIKNTSDERGKTIVAGGKIVLSTAHALNEGLYAVTALHIGKQFHDLRN